MKRSFIILFNLFVCIVLVAQVPQGFKYQAVARSSSGDVLKNQQLTLRISVMDSGEQIWSEDHPVMTGAMGQFDLIIGDPSVSGSGSVGSFENIPWSSGDISLGVEVDAGEGFVDMGTVPMYAVPYALYASESGGGNQQSLSLSGNELSISGGNSVDLSNVIINAQSWQLTGDTIFTSSAVGIGTDAPNSSLLAIQSLDAQTDKPLFEVRNEQGNPVFAVYNDGVMVFVDEEKKGVKGGFAVGGYNKATKGVTQEYLRITPDSVRIYVPDHSLKKGVKGGFAVGGYNKASKGPLQDLLYVTSDSIRMYVPDKENDPGYEGLQGGFAVETFDPEAVEPFPREYIMGVNRGITRFNTANNAEGFAIGSQGEGWGSTYMQVTPVNTFVGFESGANTRYDPNAWDANQGSRNVFLGYQAGLNNRYGHHNVFMGYQAGQSIQGDSLNDYSNSYNILIGPGAGRDLEYSYSNLFIGNSAGRQMITGEGNIMVGEGAGSQAGEAYNNILIGNYSGNGVGGSNNLMLGNSAGSGNGSGSSNVFIGSYAGSGNNGSGNVFIGSSAGSSESGNNTLVVENSSSANPLIYGDFNSDLLRFNAEVAINGIPGEGSRFFVDETRENYTYAAISGSNFPTPGTGTGVQGRGGYIGVLGYAYETGSGSRIGVYGYAGSGTSNYGIYGYAYGGTSYAVYASGNLAYTGNLVAASDAKFKEDIMPLSSVLDDLMKVTPRRYRLVESELTKFSGIAAGSQIGLVAQEVEQVFPELVVEVLQPGHPNPEGSDQVPSSSQQPGTFKGVKYLELIPILIKGIQEQQAEIETLKERISRMEQGLQ